MEDYERNIRVVGIAIEYIQDDWFLFPNTGSTHRWHLANKPPVVIGVWANGRIATHIYRSAVTPMLFQFEVSYVDVDPREKIGGGVNYKAMVRNGPDHVWVPFGGIYFITEADAISWVQTGAFDWLS